VLAAEAVAAAVAALALLHSYTVIASSSLSAYIYGLLQCLSYSPRENEIETLLCLEVKTESVLIEERVA
jgi:hypothetical protein